MNRNLDSFFKEERKRFFEPGPYFSQRVMAQVKSGKQAPAGFWDVVPAAIRPVFALALTVLFAVLSVQILIPVEPERGALEAYYSQDLTAREQMLFTDAQVPLTPEQMEALMLLEPAQ
jgi:hypothetical protein